MKFSNVAAYIGLAFCAACATPKTFPNPAAAYCVDQGGTYTLDASGAPAVCALTDGQVVDAGEYFEANSQG